MGSTRYTYIGPFVKVKLPTVTKPVTTTNKILICVNAECKHHKKGLVRGKFCPECGQPAKEDVKVTTVNETKVTSGYALTEEFGDVNMLVPMGETDDEYEWMLPNRYSDFSLRISNDVRDMEQEIPDREKAIEYFTEIYDPFLEFLKERNIEHKVCFSVINYWN